MLNTLDLLSVHLRIRQLRDINCTLAIEELGDFLHWRISRLNNEEIDDPNFKEQEHAVEKVVLPRERLERYGIDVLIEEQRDCDAEIQPGEAFGAQSIGEDFGGVGGE